MNEEDVQQKHWKRWGLESSFKKTKSDVGRSDAESGDRRALVNDPDILLADEPTGALDSDTSVQVMDLLQGGGKRPICVVMVTHNPELAEQYATRIVTLRDGKIRSDTDPYEVDETQAEPTEA